MTHQRTRNARDAGDIPAAQRVGALLWPSFFVPNTTMTITRTINQCQILNEPIFLS